MLGIALCVFSGGKGGENMIVKRGQIIVVLALFCLAMLVFSAIPAIGQTGEYNPWLDVNDDGYIGIDDIFSVASHFAAEGTPLDKMELQYDSGWLDISDKAGQYFSITHDLDSMDLMVDITGKTTADGGIHQKYFGGTDFVAGWNKTYGGTNDDSAEDLVQTADGGYALAGRTYSYGAGNWDAWLVKTDASGTMQWNKTYGGTGYDRANALVRTTDGGYALAGETASFGAGGADVWVVKTDSNGNMQWNKTYGGTGEDVATVLVQTADGGYALGGNTVSFGTGGSWDFWLVKTDAAGTMQWNKTYGGTDFEWAYAFVQTNDGGYALAGHTGWDPLVDFWLVKTDAYGNQQWNKTYGGTNHDAATALVQTFDGGYALAGYTSSWSAGDYDFWLVKTDSSGNAQWNKTYGGTGADWASVLVQTADGGYALAGGTQSFSVGSTDFWLIKTDASGTMQWNKTYGGTGEDSPAALVWNSDDGYAIAGSTFSFGAGGYDFWLVKTDAAGNAVDGFKYGLAWVDSTPNTIKLYRGTDDEYWNYVRIRIWKPKP
jgi:predicted secreted protein